MTISLSKPPKIAVVGAGPAGLVCARILTQAGIPVQVFEREETPHSRSQGGSLDLHEDTGIAAMERAGLFSEFQTHARYEGEDLVVSDRHGNILASVLDTPHGRPEIDRTRLRQILLDSLPEGTITWNSDLRSAEPGKLHFEQRGTEDAFDLIIGADGAWSKLRPLVTPIKPFYSGISGVEIRLRDVEKKHPEISRHVGNGSYFAFGNENKRCVVAQRNGDGSIRIYVVGVKPESWIDDFAPICRDPVAARNATIEDLKDWAPKYREWVEKCDNCIIPRAFYMLPVGLRWPTVSGVTVIGDAAHLMTPFAGEGVNAAMADAMKLAESIIANPNDLDTAVHEYESWMFQNSQKMTQKTWDSLMDRFSYGGAERRAAHVNARLEKRASKEKDRGKAPAAAEKLNQAEHLEHYQSRCPVDFVGSPIREYS